MCTLTLSNKPDACQDLLAFWHPASKWNLF